MWYSRVMRDVVLPKQKLEELGVAAVYLFGSRAEGVAGELSDFDVAVLFSDPLIARSDTNELYNKLYDVFSDIFNTSGFKNIDIVFLERAPLELQFDVIRHGKVLCEISRDARIDFEHRAAMLYFDFKPLLEDFNKQVLAKI